MTMTINMKELASVSCIVKGIKFYRGINSFSSFDDLHSLTTGVSATCSTTLIFSMLALVRLSVRIDLATVYFIHRARGCVRMLNCNKPQECNGSLS